MLSEKYQGLVCNEIHRILREIAKTTPAKDQSATEIIKNEERISHRRIPSEYETIASISLPMTRSTSRNRHGTIEGDPDTIARGNLICHILYY